MQPSDLHPWPVLRALVLELSSYEVPKVVDRAGLKVDWTLTTQKDFSDKMRIAAYRPRIDAAFDELSEEAKLRAVYVITGELITRGHSEKLDAALQAVGWRVEEGKLAPSSEPVRELFFPKQSQHDAYTEIRAILQTATTSITLVDPYVDQSILKLLASAMKPGMVVRILTSKLPSDFSVEKKAWLAQYPDVSLSVRTTKEFHDRFITLDESACWHIGCSIKDAGSKAFMLSRIEDEANRSVLTKQVEESWNSGAQVL